MKKTYFAPEMEVVVLKMQQTLLAGSLPVSEEEITSGDMLAPGLNMPSDNELFLP